MIAPRAALAVAACLLAAGCSSGHHASNASNASSTASGDSALQSNAPGTITSGAVASSGPASASATSATPRATAGPGTAAAPTGHVSSAVPPPAHASGFGAAKPGTYRYAVTGTSTTGPVPPSATLTVSPVSAGAQTFTLANTDSAGNGSTERETLSYRPDGVYLVAISLTTSKPAPYTLTLRPVGGPVRVIGRSASAGTTTFEVAGDGASATITFAVVGTTTATVGGKSYPAVHITLNSSDLSGMADGLAYRNGTFSVDALFATTSALAYRQQSSSAIKVSLFNISSNTTATLTSTTPN